MVAANVIDRTRPVVMSDHDAAVCVLGLGLVPAAMSIAVALARLADGRLGNVLIQGRPS